MNRSVRSALDGVDVVALVVEAGRFGAEDRAVLKLAPAGGAAVPGRQQDRHGGADTDPVVLAKSRRRGGIRRDRPGERAPPQGAVRAAAHVRAPSARSSRRSTPRTRSPTGTSAFSPRTSSARNFSAISARSFPTARTSKSKSSRSCGACGASTPPSCGEGRAQGDRDRRARKQVEGDRHRRASGHGEAVRRQGLPGDLGAACAAAGPTTKRR